MIDEITKNVTITMNILANIGILFLIVIIAHMIGPKAYFTHAFFKDVPMWIIGGCVGYCAVQLFKYYRNQS